MNRNLVRLIDDYLEDYEIFLAESGYEEDEFLMSPEAYIRGRLVNDVDRVLRSALAEMEV
jgi:hypothetical protein